MSARARLDEIERRFPCHRGGRCRVYVCSPEYRTSEPWYSRHNASAVEAVYEVQTVDDDGIDSGNPHPITLGRIMHAHPGRGIVAPVAGWPGLWDVAEEVRDLIASETQL